MVFFGNKIILIILKTSQNSQEYDAKMGKNLTNISTFL